MLNLKSHIYFNAGVLLINVNRWIDNDCSDKILDIVKKYGQKLVLPDQDALNILFSLSGDTYYLDKKYNRVELWKEQNIKEYFLLFFRLKYLLTLFAFENLRSFVPVQSLLLFRSQLLQAHFRFLPSNSFPAYRLLVVW